MARTLLGIGVENLHIRGREYPFYSTGDLNKILNKENIEKSIKRFEKTHQECITTIVNSFTKEQNVKVILIAGPTSSGKTTLAKSLVQTFNDTGFVPVEVSLDDYYYGQNHYPIDENGDVDWESPLGLELDLFNRHFNDLSQGKDVELPIFDFKTGMRKPKGRKIIAGENKAIVVEGLHGLSDLIKLDNEKMDVVRIFVNSMGRIIDNDEVILKASDFRLVRRLVRDYHHRSSGPLETFKQWRSVRRGEEKYIFPFLDTADIIFNTWLPYEVGALKGQAMEILGTVENYEVHSDLEIRLRKALQAFKEVDPRLIPECSLLNEFISIKD